jgi:PadR family transcriptional regulator PadR
MSEPGTYGRGRRRRGRGRKRGGVIRFLQTCLLLLLQNGEAHGYALLTELDRFGFDSEQMDPSLVYRALRDMEEVEWVSSRWDEESQGPRRRVYKLSGMGKDQLSFLIDDLRRTRDEIDRLLKIYEGKNDIKGE